MSHGSRIGIRISIKEEERKSNLESTKNLLNAYSSSLQPKSLLSTTYWHRGPVDGGDVGG